MGALLVAGLLIAVGRLGHGASPGAGDPGETATVRNGVIAFTVNVSSGWHVGTVNPDGVYRVILTDGVRDYGTSWSPDGTQIAYDTDQEGIWIMNADGTGKRQLTDGGDMFPRWSPEGTQIAFSRNGRGMFRANKDLMWATSHLWVVNSDGTGEHQVTSGEVGDVAGSWSPDGSKIAFLRSSADGTGLWVINSDGTGARQVAPLDLGDGPPSWSPDGRQILYTRMGFVDGNSAPRIWVVGADGTGARELLDEWATDPTWSPDGTKIAYSNGNIWVMNADGTDPHPVTNDPNEEIQPSWGIAPASAAAPST
jgi:TolB protein